MQTITITITREELALLLAAVETVVSRCGESLAKDDPLLFQKTLRVRAFLRSYVPGTWTHA